MSDEEKSKEREILEELKEQLQDLTVPLISFEYKKTLAELIKYDETLKNFSNFLEENKIRISQKEKIEEIRRITNRNLLFYSKAMLEKMEKGERCTTEIRFSKKIITNLIKVIEEMLKLSH